MGLFSSSTPKSGAVTTGVDIDYGQVDNVLKAARKSVAKQTKLGMKRAGEVATLPRVRAAAATAFPAVSVASLTVRARAKEAYVTTQGPKLNDRITGLLEFGGVVTTQITPKESGQTGLPIGSGGIIRASVNAPRTYRGKGAIRAGVAASVPTFESILLDYVVDAFDPIPHTPS
jgi:hypothetical protein